MELFAGIRVEVDEQLPHFNQTDKLGHFDQGQERRRLLALRSDVNALDGFITTETTYESQNEEVASSSGKSGNLVRQVHHQV